MHTQNPEKFVVVVPEAFSPKPMNDVQRRLQAILDYWGPNGEMWCASYSDGRGRYCAVGVVQYLDDTPETRCDKNPPWFLALERAAVEMGFDTDTPVPNCSDSGFANARKMVLRAIELAE